ncbi:MAG: hypothetical protein AB7I35_17745 [Ramlibacter sp.]|nr:hypothetical protein [Ramlibacter sp.]
MPIDTSPHGKEILHKPSEKPFPRPGDDGDHAHPKAPDPAETRARPPLPTEAQVMAADLEDEDADPVVDSGPGIADGPNTRKP